MRGLNPNSKMDPRVRRSLIFLLSLIAGVLVLNATH